MNDLQREFEQEYGHAWYGHQIDLTDEKTKIPTRKYSDWLEAKLNKVAKDLKLSKESRQRMCVTIEKLTRNQEGVIMPRELTGQDIVDIGRLFPEADRIEVTTSGFIEEVHKFSIKQAEKENCNKKENSK
jgi:hypothetical protein